MTLHQHLRPVRKTRPSMENLDPRIAPTVSSGAALAAELRVESHQVSRWETMLANARPGSHQQMSLENHIGRVEGRMAVQEARLARVASANTFVMSSAPSTVTAQPAAMPAGNPTPAPVQPSKPTPILASGPWYPFGPPTANTNAISGSTTTTTGTTSPTTSTPTTSSPGSTTPLPANVSQTLDVIYTAYEQDPSDFPADIPASSGANMVQIQGTNVGINVRDNNTADFSTFVSELQSAGMQITASSAQNGVVTGFLPVAQLPAVAALSDAPSVTPMFQPNLR